jgi:hypothetical protein
VTQTEHHLKEVSEKERGRDKRKKKERRSETEKERERQGDRAKQRRKESESKRDTEREREKRDERGRDSEREKRHLSLSHELLLMLLIEFCEQQSLHSDLTAAISSKKNFSERSATESPLKRNLSGRDHIFGSARCEQRSRVREGGRVCP